MARVRKPLKMRQEKNGQVWVVYFWHPLKKATVRISLGERPEQAQTMLDWLNKVVLDKTNWKTPPAGLPKAVEIAWGYDKSPFVEGDSETIDARLVVATLDVNDLKAECERLLLENTALKRELEHWRGKKLRSGPSPTLRVALDTWLQNYKGRDSDWTKIVGYDLARFVAHFDPAKDGRTAGESIEVDELSGREVEIDAWLRSLTNVKDVPIGAGRRAQIRRVVLRFLEDSGAPIARKAVASVKKKEICADRGGIRWLERKQAEAVAKALVLPWCDYFRIQVALGFRPDELITLKRADFHGNKFETVTLSPLNGLTLKQGPRTLRVTPTLKKILKRRFAENEILFPDPETGKPWSDPKDYNKQYNAALTAAGEAAGVPFAMDCRVPRRTCASLSLRGGMTIEEVASILGDDPATIREHYAKILPHELKASPAALKSVK